MLLFGGAFLLSVAGCNSDSDNSPSMGAVPPKPNPNMNSKLPQAVRDQIAKAKPGSDAEAMGKMKAPVAKP